MTELKLPLTVKKHTDSRYSIRDKDNKVVGFHLTKNEADDIVTACNDHKAMRKALLAVVSYDDCIRGYGMRGDIDFEVENGGGVATGEDLDALYTDMVGQTKIALKVASKEELAEQAQRETAYNAYPDLLERHAKALYDLAEWGHGGDILWENLKEKYKEEYREQAKGAS